MERPVLNDPLYNGEETVKIYGFKAPVIKEDIERSIIHKPDINKFKQFVFDLITRRGNINEKTAYELLDDDGLTRIQTGFTHPSMIGENNYEFFELLGDRSVNKSIIWYMHRRFPEISQNEKAAMYMTELKKNHENKRKFGAWAKKLGFDQYIRYTELSYVEGKYIRKVRMNDSMLEDCFESFCGVLEDLIDARIGIGVGYGIIYNIVTTLLDEEYITTDLSRLVDVKTQLKELMENASIKKFGSKFSYETITIPDSRQTQVKLNIHFDIDPKTSTPTDKTFTSYPTFKKIDAENDVSKQSLDWLKREYKFNWIDFK
jgi:dsRNA-specific ribonuclease